MDLKKGLSLVAVGYLFTLVNINLTFDDVAINIVPNFAGWILLFISFNYLGQYVEGKSYVKWIALIMVVITAVSWVVSIIRYPVDMTIINIFGSVLNCIFMFVFFGCLEKIAADKAPSREDNIRTLKILNLALSIALVVSAALVLNKVNNLTATLVLIVGLAALVTAIVTCVNLFKLKNEIEG